MKVERNIQIDAPPQRVYDVVMDPSRLEDWVTIHHHLEDAPNGSLKKGSKLTQCLKLAGRKFKVRWTVVENEPVQAGGVGGQGPGWLTRPGVIRVRRLVRRRLHRLPLHERVRPSGRAARPRRGPWRCARHSKRVGRNLAETQAHYGVTVRVTP